MTRLAQTPSGSSTNSFCDPDSRVSGEGLSLPRLMDEFSDRRIIFLYFVGSIVFKAYTMKHCDYSLYGWLAELVFRQLPCRP